MSGAAWAAASGIGFGLFQTVNRRAVARMDVLVATLLQLVVALVVLLVALLASADRTRLGVVPASAAAWFVLGGLAHFFAGWTLLNASQQRIGAARTSPLIATVPLFGALVAAVTLGELPSGLSWVAILLITGGAYVVAGERLLHGGRGTPIRWRDSAYGLGTAAAWGLSPVFIRKGLDVFGSPLLGLTLGLAASLVAYVVLLGVRGVPGGGRAAVGDAPWLKIAAGVLVALSTWGRWVALEGTTVGNVLALGLMSVPIVLLISPALMGPETESVNAVVWLGAALVVAGSLVLVVHGE